MAESRLAVIAALLANLAIAILKLAAGFFSASAAMLAEAAHSFSDVGNQVLLLVGIARADRPPSPRHPFGTGKAAYFWPFMVAILLFGVAGAYSLFEGIHKAMHPQPIGDIRWSLGVLAGAFALESISLLVALRQARMGARERGVKTVRQFLDENRDATLLTILVEDTLALMGLPIAALSLLASALTGNGIWDAVGSIAIGALLMGFAIFLARGVQRLLVGLGLSDRDAKKAMEVLASEPDIRAVAAFRTMYLGPETVLLGAEVEMQPGLSGQEVIAALARTEAHLVAAIPVLRYVFLEPHGASPKPSEPRPRTAHGTPGPGHAD